MNTRILPKIFSMTTYSDLSTSLGIYSGIQVNMTSYQGILVYSAYYVQDIGNFVLNIYYYLGIVEDREELIQYRYSDASRKIARFPLLSIGIINISIILGGYVLIQQKKKHLKKE